MSRQLAVNSEMNTCW